MRQTVQSDERFAHRLSFILLTLAFLITRFLAFRAGLRYHIMEAPLLWQLLDLDLLRHQLLRSLLHLHAQPPLFNALVGLSEKLAGPRFGEILVWIQLLTGFAAVISVYLTLIRLRVRPWFSLIGCALLLLNPAAILFEFDPLYTELVYGLHGFITLALTHYVQSRSRQSLYWLVGLSASLTLLRSSYQWIWLAALLGVLLWKMPSVRTRHVAIVCSAGICVTLLWPMKNYVLFHHFASTTWGPFSLSKHWYTERDTPPVKIWIDEGLLPTFSHDPFEPPREQQAWLRSQWSAASTGYPELDNVEKATGGATNWNSLAMLKMLDAQGRDDAFLIRHDPWPYLMNVSRGVRQYFEPTNEYVLAQGGESALQYGYVASADRVIERFCCNVFGFAPRGSAGRHATRKQALQKLCMAAVLAFFLVLACCASFMSRSFWQRDQDRKVVCMMSTVTIGYVFLIVNLIEVNENMRFRFETEPLVLMVVWIFLQEIWDRRSRLSAKVQPISSFPR